MKVNQNIQIPEHGIEKVIKSIQVFKKPINEVNQGDRAAILVQPFKTDEVDRCLVTLPGFLKASHSAIAVVDMCKYFKGNVSSKDKFHITIGHLNTMSDVYLFACKASELPNFIFDSGTGNFSKNEMAFEKFEFNFEKDYQFVHEISKDRIKIGLEEFNLTEFQKSGQVILAYLNFQKPIFILPQSFYIGSRLDFQSDSKLCRIAFSGKTIKNVLKTDIETKHFGLKLMSEKFKYGVVEKKFDEYTLIVKDMFKKETKFDLFMGKEVFLEEIKIIGKLVSTFGSSGKVKVAFNEPVDKVLGDYVGKKVFIINKKYQKIKGF